MESASVGARAATWKAGSGGALELCIIITVSWTRGMERLYEGIEQGVLKLDDTLRQRTDKLQAQRQAILTDIARLKTKATVPAHILQQKHINAFTRLVREKLLQNGAFAKEYLRLLVQEIRVNKREVKITGSYAALAQAVAGNPGDFMGVPRFVPKWLPSLRHFRSDSR
jgi:site-specific DNA recombinase